MEHKISKRIMRKALKSLSKRFAKEGLEKKDFAFVAAWIDEFSNCLLFNVIKENSPYYKSTVGYKLS